MKAKVCTEFVSSNLVVEIYSHNVPYVSSSSFCELDFAAHM